MEKFHYQGKDYDLIAYDSHHIMVYGDFGVRGHIEVSSGKAWMTIFGVNNKNVLMVKEHRVMGRANQPIGEIYPEYDDNRWSIYRDLSKLILYTGHILIANSAFCRVPFGDTLPPVEGKISAYNLEIENGKVVDVEDWSQFVIDRKTQYPTLPPEVSNPRLGGVKTWLKRVIGWQAKFLPREYRYIYQFLLPGPSAYVDYWSLKNSD